MKPIAGPAHQVAFLVIFHAPAALTALLASLHTPPPGTARHAAERTQRAVPGGRLWCQSKVERRRRGGGWVFQMPAFHKAHGIYNDRDSARDTSRHKPTSTQTSNQQLQARKEHPPSAVVPAATKRPPLSGGAPGEQRPRQHPRVPWEVQEGGLGQRNALFSAGEQEEGWASWQLSRSSSSAPQLTGAQLPVC